MKKLLAAIMVAALCAPAMAGTITFGTPVTSTGQVEIPWTADEGVVGMGIIVTTDDSIDSFTVDSFFDIFIDVAFEAGNGYAYGDGAGVDNTNGAIIGSAGVETLPSAAFAISVGGLGGETLPLTDAPTSGSIILKAAAGAANVDLAEDTLRGGVVSANGAMTIVGLPTDIVIPGGQTCRDMLTAAEQVDYDAYVAAGADPSCWCWAYQCRGDANHDTEGTLTKYRVYTNDLNKIIANWKLKIATADPCADVAHDSEGTLTKYRVYTNDLNRVIENWKKKDSALVVCPSSME